MEKSKLTGFIGRYFLGGNTDSAKLTVQGNALNTKFLTADQNVIGEVTLNAFHGHDCELGVYTTGQLLKMLSAVDEDIDIVFNSDDSGRVYSLNLSDKNTKLTYMLADLSVIRQVPALKTLPEFEIKIALNKEFAAAFKKAVSAIPESENFGVECDDAGNVNVVINHSTVATNRVIFKATAEQASAMKIVCFSAGLFKEILAANSDVTGTLEVSSKGLARVTYSSADYSATYYLVKLTVS